MFHLERSFWVIWHLFNICSPAVSRQRGLYTAQHLERQTDRLRQDRIHVVHRAIRLWPEGQRNVGNGDQGMTNCGQIKTPVIEVWIQCGERLEENFKFREAGSHPILTNTRRGVLLHGCCRHIDINQLQIILIISILQKSTKILTTYTMKNRNSFSVVPENS